MMLPLSRIAMMASRSFPMATRAAVAAAQCAPMKRLWAAKVPADASVSSDPPTRTSPGSDLNSSSSRRRRSDETRSSETAKNASSARAPAVASPAAVGPEDAADVTTEEGPVVPEQKLEPPADTKAISNKHGINNMSDADAEDWIRDALAKRSGKELQTQVDLTNGLVHVKLTANNTIVTVSKLDGDSLNWASAGSCGFKNSRRGTTYAAQVAGQKAAQAAREKGMRFVRVLFKGVGPSRAPVLKGIQAGGLKISAISDVTPVPHNGCRPKKQRRL